MTGSPGIRSSLLKINKNKNYLFKIIGTTYPENVLMECQVLNKDKIIICCAKHTFSDNTIYHKYENKGYKEIYLRIIFKFPLPNYKLELNSLYMGEM